MAIKTIPQREWAARAETDFWQPFGRTRADFSRMQIVRRQLKALRGDTEAAKQFATRLASDEEGTPWVRATCYSYLAELAEADGNIDEAIDHAMLGRSIAEIVDGQQLVQLIIEHNRLDRAAEAAQMLRDAPVMRNGLKETLDKQRAVMLSLAGHETEARKLANQAFDSLNKNIRPTMYSGEVWASKSRGLNRELFKLVRRGGRVRIVGLLGNEASTTPHNLATKLANNAFFKHAHVEILADRLIVDLKEFSLDFRWTQNERLLQNVQQRYDRFPDEDRRHIPSPPSTPETALIMLAIGDDTSHPDVINPLIELTVELESFGECIFYERVGPLSRVD